jgi:hypothetical protein
MATKEQFSRDGGAPSNPRALACLVSRDSELAYLFEIFRLNSLLLKRPQGLVWQHGRSRRRRRRSPLRLDTGPSGPRGRSGVRVHRLRDA